MLTGLAAIWIAAKQESFDPSGPKVQISFENGRSFVIATDSDRSPKTTSAILRLVKARFYDGQRIHRAENWVVQFGDPQSKSLPIDDARIGNGKSHVSIPFEHHKATFVRGVVGVAASKAKKSGDGQIFIVRKDAHMLDNNYAVLGKVIRGMDVVDHIKKGDRIKSVAILP